MYVSRFVMSVVPLLTVLRKPNWEKGRDLVQNFGCWTLFRGWIWEFYQREASGAIFTMQPTFLPKPPALAAESRVRQDLNRGE